MSGNALFDREFETLPAEAVRAHQDRLWERQWEHVQLHSDFYRRKLGRAMQRTLSLDDLQELELTDKDELRESQEACPPYGDYAACPEEPILRLHRTSGTTGRALMLANTQRDLEHIATVGARGLFAAGLRPKDRVVHCLNYCMWTGGVTDHLSLERVGATVVPYGVGGSERLLEVIRELGITAISCTPSYPALLETLLRRQGRDPRELGLRLGLFGGEAGLDNEEFRRGLEETWGFAARNANYGLSEVLSNLGAQTEHAPDLLFHGADVIFPEILDPSSGQRLPIREGTVGELVCTHLDKVCQPLVRYRTRDVVTVTGVGPAPCGRTAWRFRVTGRMDDMFNVRGVNIFPSAVQEVVASHPELSSGHFRIVLDGPGPYDRVRLKAEAPEGVPATRWDDLAARLSAAVRNRIGASAETRMVEFQSLPRTDGKTQLIERV
ncbi:MAG: AMP-binding protein [Ectothiorhodospiraceae bacterium]|jgi:phenylacetate-CoA ligase